jgi:hypothetical protein
MALVQAGGGFQDLVKARAKPKNEEGENYVNA